MEQERKSIYIPCRCLDFKRKKNKHFTGHVVNQGQRSPCVVLKKRNNPEQEKNLIPSAGVGNAHLTRSRGSLSLFLFLFLFFYLLW